MRQIIGVALMLAGAPIACAQYVISTIAGGAPLPSPISAMNTPFAPTTTAIAVDSTGNLYLAADNCIFQISPSNVMTRVAGNSHLGFSGDGGPATSAQFDNVQGIAVDSAGDIYFSDSINNRIRKVSAADGTISTVAGNGTAGHSGDGAAATAAELNGPTAVVLDKLGNLYIADTGNNRVREVGASGNITTVAGNGLAKYAGDALPAIYASLNAPSGLVFDSSGNLYIADTKNYAVRKINYAGVITTIAGTGQYQKGGLDLKPNTVATSVPLGTVGALAIGPTGILYICDRDNNATWQVAGGLITASPILPSVALAVDSAGNIYADEIGYDYAVQGEYWYNWSSVYKLSPDGTTTAVVSDSGVACCFGDGGPATSARLANPIGVALDGTGNLYIADNYDSVIRKVGPDGTINTFDPLGGARGYPYTMEGETTLYAPTSVACDLAGDLFVIDANGLTEITPKGVISTWATVYTSTAVMKPIGEMDSLAADAFGNLYVTTPEYVRKFTAANKSMIVAGTGCMGYAQDNVGANTTPVNYPMGIAVDPYDNFYFADSQNHRVRKVSGGLITTVAGNGTQGFKGDNGPATSAELNNPMGVALDSAGNLYIADTGNNRIRKVGTNGTITTIAGTGTAAYSGDGGPAAAAALNLPYTVQVDKAGNVYVADSGNNAIRVLNVNEPLALAPKMLPGGTTGVAYSSALSATGGVLPYSWSVSSGTLPPGLTLSNAGAITGKPSTPGTFDFTVTVTDSVSSTAAQSLEIKVVAPLIISAATSYQAVEGASYSQPLTATGGTPPYVWSVVSGTLPNGLLLYSNGVINGTSTTPGITYLAVQVTDSGNLTASQGLTIVVVYPAPVIATPAQLPAGATGQAYSQPLSDTCGNTPCVWSATAGTLPPGLQLSTAGVLSGTPTTAGAFSFTLTITDSASLSANQIFQLTIIDSSTL
jgi:sugar lactone lactonase YvrE